MDVKEKLYCQKAGLIRAVGAVKTPADLAALLARLAAGEAPAIMAEQVKAERDKFQIIMDELERE